ncbi:aldose 1-epimerase family protein [Herbiconiux sp. YIM B11900]|uniref:aldose 1-epimerase family protein n=1 Tax=Herbiconiux sp. YIM B11900 TaxID=3404131 RepID=UPI003F87C563
MSAVRPLSGTRIDLEHGSYRASIAGLGASLRVLQFEGRDLVLPYGVNELRPAYSGATLAPWPNRVTDGRYRFAGVEQQLPLSEPARGHALHGLALWLAFTVAERTVDAVTLTATVQAQAGYPHRLDLEVSYRLDDEGLHQSVTATNAGDDAAPFGTGPHPYLVGGPGRVDDWVFELPASEVLTVTPDRLIPRELVSVEAVADAAAGRAGAFDFREARAIGTTAIDHAFTGIARDGGGVATVTLTAADGSGVAMRFGQSCPWIQVCTADAPLDAEAHRRGLAVEPMTCPPDAFNSGTDLLVIEPGVSATASWSIAALTA